MFAREWLRLKFRERRRKKVEGLVMVAVFGSDSGSSSSGSSGSSGSSSSGSTSSS